MRKEGSKALRWVAIGLLACGFVLIGISFVIQGKIGEGKEQIAAGKEKLEGSRRAFSLLPGQGQAIGEQIQSSGNKRIAAGEEEIAYYQNIAHQLLIGGFILIAVGIGLFLIISFRKK